MHKNHAFLDYKPVERMKRTDGQGIALDDINLQILQTF